MRLPRFRFERRGWESWLDVDVTRHLVVSAQLQRPCRLDWRLVWFERTPRLELECFCIECNALFHRDDVQRRWDSRRQQRAVEQTVSGGVTNA